MKKLILIAVTVLFLGGCSTCDVDEKALKAKVSSLEKQLIKQHSKDAAMAYHCGRFERAGMDFIAFCDRAAGYDGVDAIEAGTRSNVLHEFWLFMRSVFALGLMLVLPVIGLSFVFMRKAKIDGINKAAEALKAETVRLEQQIGNRVRQVRELDKETKELESLMHTMRDDKKRLAAELSRMKDEISHAKRKVDELKKLDGF